MAGDRIVIDGDRVLRPARWWTPTVHAFLRHLREAGFDRAPLPLGIEDGVEALELIPGDSGTDGWARIVPEEGLRAFAALLHDFHATAATFEPPHDARWAMPVDEADGLRGDTICHGDFGPWNVVWRGLEPVGLLDFDFIRPGPAIDDVAYALEFSAPFRSDEQAMRWHAFPAPPDRIRRIGVFADAYGLPSTDGLVDAVIARQQASARQVRTLAAAGVEPQRTWVAEGTAVSDEQVRWTQEHRTLLER